MKGGHKSRGVAIERLFHIAEELRASSRSVGLQDLSSRVAEVSGHEWHLRTITRDCEILEYFGYVRKESPACYRWTGRQFASRSDR